LVKISPDVFQCLLQEYLRSIPKSLLTEDLFDEWVAANGVSDPAEKEKKLRE